MYTRLMFERDVRLGPCRRPAKAPRRSFQSGVAAVLAAAIFAAGMPASPARAAAADPFSTLLKPARQGAIGDTTLQHFAAAPDDRAFLLETGRGVARIQFLCAASDPRIACRIDADRPGEAIVDLSAERGSRGDVLFRDGAGRLVVRMTPYGNATVYWPGESEGRAATKREEYPGALRLTPFTYGEAAKRAARAESLLAELGVTVRLDVGALSIANEYSPAPALTDAVLRAAEAVEALADDADASPALKARPVTLRFVEGRQAGAASSGDDIVVTYIRAGGAAGAPSEADLAAAIRGAL